MLNKEIEQEHIEMQKKFNEFRLKNGLPPENFKFVAVGYLDTLEPYEKGDVSTNFLVKLQVLWNEGITLGSAGHHECQFCIKEGNYKGRATSSSEKTLTDKENKITYIFPEMIFHYIKIHKYLPPPGFISLVIRS